jgi:uncharacterized protein involved in cysteine biosynthesis
MIGGFFKALEQLPEPAFRGVVMRTLGWSVLLFTVLLAAAWYGMVSTRIVEMAWLETVIDWLGGFVAMIVAIVLFPGAAMVIISFMLEDIAAAVETRHYPELGEARAQPVSEAVFMGLKFALVTVALNILVLPLYFVPVLNVFVFGALNGYLLGREYFELVALRRLDAAAARAMRKRYRARLWIAGAIIAFLLGIPFVNWVMPVVAVAFMLHLFEGLRRREAVV